ncbi:protease Do-like 9 [Rhododendron vialii]|uniref:protease Do-like 9 n=1 Tax=Rhododendron vialii TaxID=182163 RepID=UPI00265FE28B|nr:protease Do-like 9 [Rhododendron vialii]
MMLTTSSPIADPLFCKFKSTNVDSKKPIGWPPVVSCASKFPVANNSFQSFLSISSDLVDHCTLLVHNRTSNIIGRSFTSRASVRGDVSSLGKKLLVLAEDREDDDDDDDDEHELKNIPQLDAVVKVFCIMAEPDFASPWGRVQEESYSTGLIVSGRKVLTTAHSVDHHTLVKLKKHNCDTMYTATMLAIAPECDLAMLTVHDDEFWKAVKPVEFGDMPSPGDKLIFTGYREDRDYVSLMAASVSRLSMRRYSFWGTTLLALQVNVAGNGAIYEGPVFDEICKCVGIEFQSKGNKSDVIPAEVIKHFIQDYDNNGAFTGLPLLAIKWQKMESPYLRLFMKMEHDEQGVLITEVKPNYPESVILKPYDVLFSIDGIDINNDGTVPFSRGQRIEFSYLIGKKYNGDKIVIKVRRGSEIHEFIINLATHKQFVSTNIIGIPLPYYIIGGFVFTTLSFPYMQVMDGRYDRYKTPDEDELFSQALYEERVVLCQVLKADVNDGCDMELLVQDQVLVTFNDKPVEGLKSLVSMVEICNEDFMKFTFGNHKILVLPTNIARSRTPDILQAHSIGCAMSDDLKKVVKLTQGKESPIDI